MNGLPTSAPRDGASSPALYDITPNMVALVSSVRDKFGARYAREDLEAVYAEMMRQKKQKTTGYAFRKKELVWMLNCCGLDCTLQTPDRDLRAQIAQLPSRETLEAGLFAELYRIYTSFPSSGLYMERLVRRLGDPDLGGGSVRMAILKQFIRHTDYHTAAILRQVAGQDPAAYAAACAAVPQKARRQASAEYVLAHITEDIFSLLHQQDVQLSETDLARISLRSMLRTGALTQPQLDSLGASPDGRPFHLVLQQLLEQVEAGGLSAPQQREALRLTALARSRADALDPGIRRALRASDAQKKKDALDQLRREDAWQLLKLCDDLASGRFRTNGRTRTDLYLFAIAFGMTVNTGAPGSFCPDTDVEKNLFHDFYADNLVRYLSADYAASSGDYEAEPSGEGINYKNFAEVIYLYYLCRPGLSPRQKIKKANLMIRKCFAAAAQARPAPQAGTPFYTGAYRALFLDTICGLPEAELLPCILQNFRIETGLQGKARTAIASGQVAARQAYDRIAAELLECQPGSAVGGVRCAPDAAAGGVVNFGLDIDLSQAGASLPPDPRFRTVLQSMDRMLRIRLPDEGRVTRTRLIAAFYYLYLLRGSGEEMSLPELCEDFCAQIDPILEQARYQKISEKNLFDVFVLISLYRLENLI